MVVEAEVSRRECLFLSRPTEVDEAAADCLERAPARTESQTPVVVEEAAGTTQKARPKMVALAVVA